MTGWEVIYQSLNFKLKLGSVTMETENWTSKVMHNNTEPEPVNCSEEQFFFRKTNWFRL